MINEQVRIFNSEFETSMNAMLRKEGYRPMSPIEALARAPLCASTPGHEFAYMPYNEEWGYGKCLDLYEMIRKEAVDRETDKI